MSRWIQDEHGDWLNMGLAVRVRFDGPKATIWFLDGAQATASQNLDALHAWLRGDPPKDALISAYRSQDHGIG